MANKDSPFGLRPVGHLLGLPWSGKARPYYVPTASAALFIGDPVIKVAAGSNAEAVHAPGAGSFGIGTLPAIDKATAGDTNAITGVVVGFAADPDNLSLIHRPTGTERIAFVCDDPFVIYEIQGDSAGTLAAANIGLNANLIFTHSGSTGTGLSGAELNTSTEAVTATFQLKVLRAVNREDNDVTLVHAKYEVLINNHNLMPGTLGIA